MTEVVKTACKVCGEHVKVHSLRNHTKKVHQMKITEYKSKFNQYYFDLVELVLHKCGICGEHLLLDSDSVANHLRGNGDHNISHANYNAQYMNLMKTQPSAKATDQNEKSQKHAEEKQNLDQKKDKATHKKNKDEKQKNLNFNGSKMSDSNEEKKTDPKVDQNKFNDLVAELQNLNESNNSIAAYQVDQTCNIEISQTQYFNAEGLGANKAQEDDNQDINVEGFQKFLDSMSEDSENLRYPVLEMLLTLNI